MEKPRWGQFANRARLSLLPRLRALQAVQCFVPLVHARTRLLFARKGDGVFQVADDAAVTQMQFGGEVECDRHAALTKVKSEGSAG